MSDSKNEFLQVWDYLIDNESLDVSDVLLLSKIISLHNTKDGCYLSNDGICKLLRLKNKETASRRITKLENLGYIQLRYIPLPSNKEKTRRFIIPTYQKGLIQKSTPIDSKVNTPLTLKSTPPCLESQSIISTYNINDNIRELDNSEHITELNKQLLIASIKEKILDEKLSYICIELVSGNYLTKNQKQLITSNKNKLIKSIPILKEYIN